MRANESYAAAVVVSDATWLRRWAGGYPWLELRGDTSSNEEAISKLEDAAEKETYLMGTNGSDAEGGRWTSDLDGMMLRPLGALFIFHRRARDCSRVRALTASSDYLHLQ